MTHTIIRLPEVIKRTGLSRSQIYALMQKSRDEGLKLFPQSIALGERAVGWLERDIDAWIKTKIQASNYRYEDVSIPK